MGFFDDLMKNPVKLSLGLTTACIVLSFILIVIFLVGDSENSGIVIGAAVFMGIGLLPMISLMTYKTGQVGADLATKGAEYSKNKAIEVREGLSKATNQVNAARPVVMSNRERKELARLREEMERLRSTSSTEDAFL